MGPGRHPILGWSSRQGVGGHSLRRVTHPGPFGPGAAAWSAVAGLARTGLARRRALALLPTAVAGGTQHSLAQAAATLDAASVSGPGYLPTLDHVSNPGPVAALPGAPPGPRPAPALAEKADRLDAGKGPPRNGGAFRSDWHPGSGAQTSWNAARLAKRPPTYQTGALFGGQKR